MRNSTPGSWASAQRNPAGDDPHGRRSQRRSGGDQQYLRDPAAHDDDYTGSLLLVKDIVIRYLRGGVMPYDAAHDGFTVTGLGRRWRIRLLRSGAGRNAGKFANVADRIDASTTGRCAWSITDQGPTPGYRGGSLFLARQTTAFRHPPDASLCRALPDAGRRRQYLRFTTMRAMNRPDYLPTLDDGKPLSGGRYTLYADLSNNIVRRDPFRLYDPAVPFRQCGQRHLQSSAIST